MKNKGSTAFVIILILVFLSSENGATQSGFLVKAGPTFAFSDRNNYRGSGGGIEKQISERWSFSLTLEYLKTNIPDSTAIKNDIQNYYYSETFNESVLGINPEFRFYKRKNPLSLREGFFKSVGIEIGQLTSTRYIIEDIYVGNTPIPVFQGTIHQKSLLFMTRWSLGIAIHLKENLSLELSGGIKAGKASHQNIIGLIPLTAKLRYALKKN